MAGPTGTPQVRSGAQQRRSIVVTPVQEPVATPPAAPPLEQARPAHASVPTLVVSPAPAGPSLMRDNQQLTFGLIVVVSGFVAILLALWLVVINYHAASDATAILGIITTAVAGLGGAFFGVAVGQQGTVSANKDRAAAEAAKDEAFHQTLRFAAHLDPSVAKRLVD
jgi:hypothetical protein